MTSPKWARLQTEYPCPLRRGAWYRVLNASPLEVVVDVHQKQVRVPRRHLQLADQPMQMWTVVERAEPSPRSPRSLGSTYAVCPSCRERLPLAGQPANMRCPQCNGLFTVAWTGPERKEVPKATTAGGDRPRRTSSATIPRKRGPDRRTANRRQEATPVTVERRAGSERRQGADRRKARSPRGPTAAEKAPPDEG